MVAVIFVGPVDESDIRTLFGAITTKVNIVTAPGIEPKVEDLRAEVNNVMINNADIVYVVDSQYATSLNTGSLDNLTKYLTRMLVATPVDGVELFYLSNFMDNCIDRVELTVQPTAGDETGIKNHSMTNASAPNGMAGLVTTKAKWLNILTKAAGRNERNLSAKLSALVVNGDLKAATSQPLFIFPDLLKQTDALDVLKTHYCRLEKNFGRSVPNTENLSLFWFIVGASIVVVCAWALSYYTPNHKVVMVNKYR